MFRILIVEDDKNSAKLMSAVLSRGGYETYVAHEVPTAYVFLEKYHIDLIVADLMLPKVSGFEFVETLRDSGDNTPVIMVTAKGEQVDKRHGFLAGADDYMVKPVDEDELLLRVHALLRRAKIVNERKLTVGSIEFDYQSLSYKKDGTSYELPKKEFLLIYKLLSEPNKIFTRMQLMDDIWGPDTDSSEKTVDVHINRLRKHFEDTDDFEIAAVRGVGYKAVINGEKNK
ncbi:MAG: response regulator transcription factor [Clostridiales bacterium]|nr:response regulator transcription factor [Clostridiales bacterium]MCD7827522.1 response regulator transcription factor [Clostridiales bacterium]